MVPPAIVFMMYHELELTGRALCQSGPGYVRYILIEADFRSQMRWLQQSGWRSMSVGEALTFPEEHSVAVTFDDGCETDLIAAAPALKDTGNNATFYVTVGFLGKPGYLSPPQLRELGALGFEVGCHSMTHPYLSDLRDDQLHREIAIAKVELEQITGCLVEHFSCPGGRWDRRVAEVAERAGYRSVATSRAIANSPYGNPFSLGRVAVMRETSLPAFQRLCQGRGLWKLQVRDVIRSSAKRLFGNSAYDRMRSLFLNRSTGEH
jgi:peptidoglycan/xylan/chitin deacetylase (PgdA/CDA1 family)